MKDILMSLSDLDYKKFHSRLMPTISPDRIIGVRVPQIRKLAKEYINQPKAKEFLSELPHKYYEENNLHAFLIEQIKDFDECIKEVESFLPFIDNWATCDSLRPKCFKNNTDKLLPFIEKWISSYNTYTVRFGIEMLMVYYLDDRFDERYMNWVASVKSDEYYINMMIAWYFATALAKRWESAVKYIEENRLSLWVHNKTVQKATESYRITENQKEYLRSLKR